MNDSETCGTASIDDLRIMRLPEVRKATGLSRPAVYRAVAAGELAPPVQLTARSVGWRVSDIRHWLATRSPAQVRVNASESADHADSMRGNA
ncbi:AlpA family phage regulatory protein [Algiphilus sp.]|uniref:helix-turn-helix transcriptional regulator n=1 Tax=Algiphilus sp. TaxID=1872431 RepID=UPI0032F071F5